MQVMLALKLPLLEDFYYTRIMTTQPGTNVFMTSAVSSCGFCSIWLPRQLSLRFGEMSDFHWDVLFGIVTSLGTEVWFP